MARRRISHVVEIVGDPGIGKTRLVEELRTFSVGFTQLEARCGQYTISAPYFPWRMLLRPLAGLTPDDPAETAGEQLRIWVEAVMPDLAQWLPLLAIPFDVQVPTTKEVEELDPGFRRQRLHETVEQFLQRVLMMPTLLVFEDAHWMDDASRELLRHLTARPAPRPWLVAVTRRPSEHGFVTAGAPGASLLELVPLSDAATAQLLLAAAGQEVALSEAEVEGLSARSGGNPLFIRELVANARHEGAQGALPETVEMLITTRIDTLEPSDRLLLRYASVIGGVFELGLLDEVASAELGEVRSLERWERLGEFVGWEGEDALRFRNDLFRSVAYESLSFRRRRQIHGIVGEALEVRVAGEADSISDLLSLHFLRAEQFDKAWQYSMLAGERAQTMYANVVSAELYDRALEAAEHLPTLAATEIGRAAENLGDVAQLAARYDTAGTAFERARDLLADDPMAQARLMLKEGLLREFEGKFTEAVQWFQRGLRALEGVAERDAAYASARARLELAHAALLFRQGQLEDSIQSCERAIPFAEESGDRQALARAYWYMGSALADLGNPEGTAYYERALPVFVEVGDLAAQGEILNNLGVNAYLEGRWDEALAHYEESREAKERAGDVRGAALGPMNMAEILSDQGQLEQAEEMFNDCLRVWRAAGYALGTAVITGNLGRAAARAGRFDEARELLDEALRAFEGIGAASFVLETLGRRAEADVLAGAFKEARTLIETIRARAEDATAGATLNVMLDRLEGYATMQAREPRRARPPLERSLEEARRIRADYEVALTLEALSELEERVGSRSRADEYRQESNEILDRLGVVYTPRVPLP
jgi:tetratricopeptide (TPR) repeat protein